MADLSSDEKIAIGVGSGLGGLILIGLIILLLWTYFSRDDGKRSRANKYGNGVRYSDDRRYPPYDDDRYGMDYYNRGFQDGPYVPSRPYPIDDRKYRPKRELPPEPYPVPYPPRPIQQEIDKKFYPRWDGNYRQDPVVVPMTEPEYVRSADAPRREAPETLYVQYQDDQAIMEDANYRRRSQQYPLRRSGSLRDLRDTRQPYGRSQRRPKYVGEWERPADRMDEFNENAYNVGRDPFLWQ